MGMNRSFELDIAYKNGDKIEDPVLLSDIFNEIDECCGGWEYGYYDEPTFYITQANWYSNHEDMKCIALKYPDVLFILTCYGETLDDIWSAGYCGTREDFQSAYIPPLDLATLRKP